MYSKKLNISFICIPKTAGTTINTTFMKEGYFSFNVGHTTFDEILNKKDESHFKNNGWPNNYPDIIMKSYKMSVIRHPYDRMVSYFSYIKKYEKHIWGSNIKDLTFEEFINKPMIIRGDMKDNKKWGLLYQQKAFWSLTDFLFFNGKLMVDKVINFENFQEEINNVIKQRGGKEMKFLHKLKSDSSRYKLSDKQRELVYLKYKDDFKNFNLKK